MSNIEQNLANILGSRYGKDVRQAIHDSIQTCYTESKFVPRGAYSSTATYSFPDVVTHGGGSYLSINPTPAAGVPVTNTSHWQQIADKGDQGIQGVKGNKGDPGPRGTPVGSFATLSALQTAHPDGNPGAFLVRDNNHLYFWNGTAWEDGGLYAAADAAAVNLEDADGYFDSDDIEGVAQEVGEQIDNLQKFGAFNSVISGGLTRRSGGGRSLVTFISDDSAIRNYSDLIPLANTNGIKVCVALSPGLFGTFGNMTEDQAKDLVTQGHEALGHSWMHNIDVEGPEETLIEDTRLCAEGLQKIGSPSKGFVYAFGAASPAYKNAVARYFSHAYGDDGINIGQTVEDPFIIARRDLDNPIATLKSWVDAIDGTVGWLVFMGHSTLYTGSNATKFTELVNYIKSKGIEIVTATDGYREFGYDVALGDRYSVPRPFHREPLGDHIYINKYGMKSNKNNFIKNETYDTVPATTAPTSYQWGAVTKVLINSTYGDANGYPLGGGMCITVTPGFHTYTGETKLHYQLFLQRNSERTIWARFAYDQNTWDAWRPISGFVELGNYPANTTPQTYPSGVTKSYLNAQNVGTFLDYGTPNSNQGILLTYKSAKAATTFVHQVFFPYTSNTMYKRKGLTNTTWSDWVEVGHHAGNAAGRDNFQVVGEMYYDTSLGKPVWCKTAGTRPVATFTVTAGATASGNIKVKLQTEETVAVEAGDTAIQVADKCRVKGFGHNQVSGTPGTNTFTIYCYYKYPHTPTFTPADTGVTMDVSLDVTGVSNVWVDATGTTV